MTKLFNIVHVREFEFHGYLGKRRVASFGWHYDFSGQKLRKADDTVPVPASDGIATKRCSGES